MDLAYFPRKELVMLPDFLWCSSLTYNLVSLFDLLFTVKVFICCHVDELCQCPDPVFALMEAMSCITIEQAYGWFQKCSYIVV